MKHIYIVEDDTKIAGLLAEFLTRYDYQVTLSKDYTNITAECRQIEPHLILMDINLPRFDGFYWCRQIRTFSNCPIIFLSARNSGMDQVMAIENGGDDYITKPFEFEVVLAKVRGMIRRVYGEYAESRQASFLFHNGLNLQLESLELAYKETILPLTKKEFLLLKEFIQHPNQVLSRHHLLEILWDDHHFVDDNTLSVNITRTRKKLEDLGLPEAIQTVRGMGYKFMIPGEKQDEKVSD